jgi:integrase
MPSGSYRALDAQNIFSTPSQTSDTRIRINSRSLTCGTSEKRFRRIGLLAKVENLRIHDLRHYATTVLFISGIPDSIISKMTGHRSRELKRYQRLSSLLSNRRANYSLRNQEKLR